MRKNVLVIAFLIALVVPAVAQKAQIEVVNAKWMELFNKGDFQGIAELYAVDAIALPPGSAMVRGKAAIGAMWKGMVSLKAAMIAWASGSSAARLRSTPMRRTSSCCWACAASGQGSGQATGHAAAEPITAWMNSRLRTPEPPATCRQNIAERPARK